MSRDRSISRCMREICIVREICSSAPSIKKLAILKASFQELIIYHLSLSPICSPSFVSPYFLRAASLISLESASLQCKALLFGKKFHEDLHISSRMKGSRDTPGSIRENSLLAMAAARAITRRCATLIKNECYER